MNISPLQMLIHMFSKLPGMGPRSAQRAVLHLLKHKDQVMIPLTHQMEDTAKSMVSCHLCGNWDTQPLCGLCSDPHRDSSLICVVETVADLWAMARTSYKGHFHVLGGVLSAIEGVGPDDLKIQSMVDRVATGKIQEVILALGVTLDGQTTGFYLADLLKDFNIKITRLAQGIPMGGELNYLDDGTLIAAFHARSQI